MLLLWTLFPFTRTVVPISCTTLPFRYNSESLLSNRLLIFVLYIDDLYCGTQDRKPVPFPYYFGLNL